MTSKHNQRPKPSSLANRDRSHLSNEEWKQWRQKYEAQLAEEFQGRYSRIREEILDGLDAEQGRREKPPAPLTASQRALMKERIQKVEKDWDRAFGRTRGTAGREDSSRGASKKK